jgi:hypothetical protein
MTQPPTTQPVTGAAMDELGELREDSFMGTRGDRHLAVH